MEEPVDVINSGHLRLWCVWLIWSVWSLWSTWFVWFIELVSFNQIIETNQTDEIDQTDQTTAFLRWRIFQHHVIAVVARTVPNICNALPS